jgi:flagellar basal-body rod protein FlgC
MDEVSGADVVKVSSIGFDPTPFNLQLDPGNPAADGKGFVKIPNVNLLMEMGDMREANRSYEANLQVIKQSNALLSMTIGLLKG